MYILPKSELKLMNEIWKHKTISTKELWNKMYKKYGYARTTTLTLIRRLYDRKFINREKQGRYYVLIALINKDEYQNNFIDDIVKNVFEGCEAELMDKLLNRNSVELKN